MSDENEFPLDWNAKRLFTWKIIIYEFIYD